MVTRLLVCPCLFHEYLQKIYIFNIHPACPVVPLPSYLLPDFSVGFGFFLLRAPLFWSPLWLCSFCCSEESSRRQSVIDQLWNWLELWDDWSESLGALSFYRKNWLIAPSPLVCWKNAWERPRRNFVGSASKKSENTRQRMEAWSKLHAADNPIDKEKEVIHYERPFSKVFIPFLRTGRSVQV